MVWAPSILKQPVSLQHLPVQIKPAAPPKNKDVEPDPIDPLLSAGYICQWNKSQAYHPSPELLCE